MSIDHVFAGLPVSRRDVAVSWYEKLLGRPPDMLPHDGEATWRLTDGASLWVVVDPARAGRGLVTLVVPDLDAEVTALGWRGLTAGSASEVPGAGRKAHLADPDGNDVVLVELLDRS